METLIKNETPVQEILCPVAQMILREHRPKSEQEILEDKLFNTIPTNLKVGRAAVFAQFSDLTL